MIQPVMPHELSPGNHSALELSIEEDILKTLASQLIKLEILTIRVYRRCFAFFNGRSSVIGVRGKVGVTEELWHQAVNSV